MSFGCHQTVLLHGKCNNFNIVTACGGFDISTYFKGNYITAKSEEIEIRKLRTLVTELAARKKCKCISVTW